MTLFTKFTIFFLIAIQMICVAFKINFWPLTDYPMFALPKKIENTYGISLFYIPEYKSPIHIPINGGATIMYIYSQAIRNEDFLSLKKQISRDLTKFLFTQRLKVGANDRIILKKMGIKKNKSQLHIYTITNILDLSALELIAPHN